jgi:peptidyl-prolyl cis-trans isomerase C
MIGKLSMSNKIKLSIIIFLFFILNVTVLIAEEPASAASQTQVVAEINSRKISSLELEQEFDRQFPPQLKQLDDAKRNPLKNQLLQRMIDRELLFQAAQKSDSIPSKLEVESFINEIQAQHASKEAFEAMLQERKLSKDKLEKEIQMDLAIKNYIENKIVNDITVTDSEIREAFDASPEKFQAPEEVRARHILFKVDPSAAEETVQAARDKAGKVLSEVKANPAAFPDAAKNNSEGPTRAKGGDLGYFSKDQMVPEFAEVAFSMKEGEISDLVRTQFGFHIIKVEDKRGGEAPTFEAVRGQVENALMSNKQQEAIVNELAALRKNGKVILYIQ